MIRDYTLFLFRFAIEILVSRVLRTDLERKHFLALHENQILRRKHGKRPPALRSLDRHFFVAVGRVSRSLLNALTVIRPETVLSYPSLTRTGFGIGYDQKGSRQRVRVAELKAVF